MHLIVWHGTNVEAQELVDILQRNCACDPEANFVCAGHLSLANEQRFSDGMVFARTLATRLNSEEFMDTPVVLATGQPG